MAAAWRPASPVPKCTQKPAVTTGASVADKVSGESPGNVNIT